jgi:hypothetical protein
MGIAGKMPELKGIMPWIIAMREPQRVPRQCGGRVHRRIWPTPAGCATLPATPARRRHPCRTAQKSVVYTSFDPREINMRAFLVASHCLLLGVASAASAAEPVPAPPLADKSQEIVCRKEKETGSLVKSKKTCHSRAQWQYIDETNQSQARSMQDDMRTKPGGN